MNLERVNLFSVSNKVEEVKQVATILSVIGGKTYTLLAPDKSLKQLKKTLQTYFESKHVVIVEHYQFHRIISICSLIAAS